MGRHDRTGPAAPGWVRLPWWLRQAERHWRHPDGFFTVRPWGRRWIVVEIGPVDPHGRPRSVTRHGVHATLHKAMAEASGRNLIRPRRSPVAGWAFDDDQLPWRVPRRLSNEEAVRWQMDRCADRAASEQPSPPR